MADGCKKERYTSTKEKSRHQSSFLSIIISHSDLHSSDICDATFITSTYLHESFAHQPLWPEQGVHTAGLRMPLTKSFESSGLARIFLYLGRSRYQQTCRRGYGITEQIWYRGLLHRKGGVTLAHAHSYELWMFPKHLFYYQFDLLTICLIRMQSTRINASDIIQTLLVSYHL